MSSMPAAQALGDLFNDGHINVVINSMDSTPSLLRNVVKNGNHWIEFKLVGGPENPARCHRGEKFCDGRGVRQRGDVYSGGSYGSNSDPRLHFGLGSSSKIEKVEVQWPSGRREQFSVRQLDQILTLVEGRNSPESKHVNQANETHKRLSACVSSILRRKLLHRGLLRMEMCNIRSIAFEAARVWIFVSGITFSGLAKNCFRGKTSCDSTGAHRVTHHLDTRRSATLVSTPHWKRHSQTIPKEASHCFY